MVVGNTCRPPFFLTSSSSGHRARRDCGGWASSRLPSAFSVLCLRGVSPLGPSVSGVPGSRVKPGAAAWGRATCSDWSVGCRHRGPSAGTGGGGGAGGGAVRPSLQWAAVEESGCSRGRGDPGASRRLSDPPRTPWAQTSRTGAEPCAEDGRWRLWGGLLLSHVGSYSRGFPVASHLRCSTGPGGGWAEGTGVATPSVTRSRAGPWPRPWTPSCWFSFRSWPLPGEGCSILSVP